VEDGIPLINPSHLNLGRFILIEMLRLVMKPLKGWTDTN
jgi:hypothetical protein